MRYATCPPPPRQAPARQSGANTDHTRTGKGSPKTARQKGGTEAGQKPAGLRGRWFQNEEIETLPNKFCTPTKFPCTSRHLQP
jgi:hypothetical protein